MDTLIRQLLSYSKYRTVHDEKLSELYDQKRELKKLKIWDEQQERESKDSRLAQEYELEQMKKEGTEGKTKLPLPPSMVFL